jgi:hypothetical protein
MSSIILLLFTLVVCIKEYLAPTLIFLPRLGEKGVNKTLTVEGTSRTTGFQRPFIIAIKSAAWDEISVSKY